MPQPHRSGLFIGLHTLDAAAYPECAVAMYRVVNMWSSIEQALISMFGLVTGESRATSESGWVTNPNLVAAASLKAIENLHTRMTVVIAAWEAANIDADFRQRFQELVPKLRRAAGERNTVVHGLWVAAGDRYPSEVVNVHNGLRYKATDFDAMYDRLYEVEHDIRILSSDCTRRKAGLPEWPPLDQLPTPAPPHQKSRGSRPTRQGKTASRRQRPQKKLEA